MVHDRGSGLVGELALRQAGTSSRSVVAETRLPADGPGQRWRRGDDTSVDVATRQRRWSRKTSRADTGQPGTVRTRDTWRRTSRRGERHRARLNPELDRTHRTVEQSLEVPTGGHGSRATGDLPHGKGHGGSRHRRDGDAAEREKPLYGEPWTWLRDETSPRCRWWSKPSRGCENLRTERSGRLGYPAQVDSTG